MKLCQSEAEYKEIVSKLPNKDWSTAILRLMLKKGMSIPEASDLGKHKNHWS